jgi:two-component system, response regulator
MQKKIILVEDNFADAELVRIAVDELGFGNEVIATNGSEEFFQILDREPTDQIGMIMLDLNMPRINGIEVLRKVRNTPRYAFLPIIIFTTSSNKNDIAICYDLRASAYVFKPIDYDAFNDIIKATVRFWIDTNLLPKQE